MLISVVFESKENTITDHELFKGGKYANSLKLTHIVEEILFEYTSFSNAYSKRVTVRVYKL